MEASERAMASQYILTNTPDSILEQFANITATISEYKQKTESGKVSEQDKIEYLNGAYNSVNIINKFLALILDNPETLKSIKPIPKNTVEKNKPINKESKNKEKPITKNKQEEIEEYLIEDLEEDVNSVDDSSPKEIIASTLDNWGLDEDSFAYRCLISLADIKPWSNKEYTAKELIAKVAKKFGKTNAVVASAITLAIKKADFSYSPYIPVLSKMDKSDINKEFIVTQLYDFVKES